MESIQNSLQTERETNVYVGHWKKKKKEKKRKEKKRKEIYRKEDNSSLVNEQNPVGAKTSNGVLKIN